VARPTDHPALLEAAHRGLAASELAWLGSARASDDAEAPLQRLFSDEGGELLEQASRDGSYQPQEWPWVVEQLEQLARARVLLEVRPLLASLLSARVPLAHGAESMPALVTRLVSPPDQQHEPGAALRAIEHALAPHARRWLDLLARAQEAARAQRTAAEKLAPPTSAKNDALATTLEHLGAGATRGDSRTSSSPSTAEVDALAALASSPLTAAHGSLDAIAKLLTSSEAVARLGVGPSASPSELLAAIERASADGAESAPPPTAATVQLAERWLTQTDDAARELTRWLAKRSAAGADLPQLMAAVRGRQWDGLARSSQRFFRIAAGARGLGFERDMSARMRGELGKALLAPLARCVAPAIPDDVRVVQPGLEYGLLSDFAAAQAMGEGLALALTSPVSSVAQRRPIVRSVSRAFGGLFAQLRADRNYLMRVDGLEREVAANAARHTGLWLLLRARMAAALFVAWQAPARSESEQLQQLMVASARALGKPLTEGMSALALLLAAEGGGDFTALADGCALHAALRELHDHDFYRNPRISDVLRGAAARGNALAAAGLIEELGASPEAGITRALELVC
jgi:hypothetical protein